jgi:hypothetical protein
MRVLLIGGAKDGLFEEVEMLMPTLRVESMEGNILMGGNIRSNIYTLHQMQTGRQIFYLYVDSSLDLTQAIERLITNYEPPH